MNANNVDQRLSRIQTQWTMLLQGPETSSGIAPVAQQLLLRYYGAAYRYLLGMLRNADAAEELTQEFAVRFLRGDFQQADPGRGRFRDFLKTALRHLAIDHCRRQAKAPGALSPEDGAAIGDSDAEIEDLDRPFLDKWREELLARAWEGLAKTQTETGQPYHSVLRCKTEQPEARSAQIAERLSGEFGKAFTVEGVRQLLHRARGRFADLLLDEVAHSLQTTETEKITQELIELGLLDYCKPALTRRDVV
jgi:RNA polymerase sigma-70 factor (ECF subfamily)